jgi:CRISPR-associated endonuclease/helicase Cas3
VEEENMTRQYYAHSLEGKPPSEWQPLEEHLRNVGELARKLTDDFNAGVWGYLAGLWHDVRRL